MAASVQSYDFLDPPSRSGDLGMLGHYCVISELGRGGMGFVFRAEDIKLKRAVALKVMNQKIAATPNSRRRFIHEARAMAAVHHDNVATIFEVGESKGTPFMAMEMLKGSTIETFNKAQTQLDYEKIIDYARQIARGLSAAHVKGIVHRDIKPANIWIEEGTDRIKILDFGLALASTPVDHLAGRGAVIGTPGYLSPEQARSEPLDDRSDLYSLGVVLYELCTGKLPIQEKSVPGQLISILAHRPTPIKELNPDIPQPLCQMVHRLLRKEPRSRPSSAAKLEEDLQQVEVDCHAKSEVAQAINKLQMGLSEVVSKTESDSFFDTVDELQETIPDPLAVIPEPVAMVGPARPVTRNAPSAAAAPPAWLAYWPIAAIGAVVLIALPVLTFAFSGWGSGNEAYVVAGTSSSGDDATEQATSPSSQQQQKPAARTEKPSAASKPPIDTPTKPNANAQGSSSPNRPNPGNDSKGPKNRSEGKPKTPTPDGENKPGEAAATKPAAKDDSASVVPVATKPDSADEPETKPTAPKPAAPKPTIELKWTVITTDEGRGADTMVQNGTSQKLGLKPSIGVATRNRVETNHSYLRFDLAKIEDVKSHVKSAGILLTLVSREPPLGGVVRVFGIDDLPLWPEQGLDWKNSFSKEGLDSLTKLGEVTITAENLAKEKGRSVIRVTSPEFTKFIADASGDTVTIVISGSGKGSDLLRFVSRESASKTPPRLLVQVPKNPPPVEKKDRR